MTRDEEKAVLISHAIYEARIAGLELAYGIALKKIDKYEEALRQVAEQQAEPVSRAVALEALGS